MTGRLAPSTKSFAEKRSQGPKLRKKKNKKKRWRDEEEADDKTMKLTTPKEQK